MPLFAEGKGGVGVLKKERGRLSDMIDGRLCNMIERRLYNMIEGLNEIEDLLFAIILPLPPPQCLRYLLCCR